MRVEWAKSPVKMVALLGQKSAVGVYARGNLVPGSRRSLQIDGVRSALSEPTRWSSVKIRTTLGAPWATADRTSTAIRQAAKTPNPQAKRPRSTFMPRLRCGPALKTDLDGTRTIGRCTDLAEG